jgi:Cft2 family RNA processing exonuclease
MKGTGAERLPDLSPLEDRSPTAILVTHAHLDHIGALPVLHQRFPHVPVYATAPTIDLTRIQLLDSLKIMAEEASVEGELPLYSEATVESLLERMRPVVPLRPFRPDLEGPEVTYFPAGHILGACSLFVAGREERVLLSGDISVDNQRTIPGMSAPRFRADVAVFESTYGGRLLPPRAVEERRLVETVAATVAAGGKVLVPAFAIGRAQEVLLILLKAQLAKEIPLFPIHADGMVRRVCSVYAQHPWYLQSTLRKRVEKHGDPFFGPLESVRPVKSAAERAAVMAGPPAVVVTSSGMLSGGPSPLYARAWLGDERNLIAITGYQDEESPGRRLLDLASGAARTMAIDGVELEPRARVATYALSGHASGAQIAAIARAVGAADCFLVHGDVEARADLAQLFVRERLGRVCLPRHGEPLEPRGRRKSSAPGSARSPVAVRLDATVEPGGVDWPALSARVLELYPEGRAFTAVELFAVAHGRAPDGDQAAAFEAALRGTDRFAPHPTRLFHFVAVPAGPPQSDGPMEVNALARRIDEALAAAADHGLIRKSFEAGATRMTLVFEFPRVARERLAGVLAAAFEGTGWTFDLHPQPNPAALEREIRALLPEGRLLARAPSLRLEEQAVVLHLSRPLFEEEVFAWESFRASVLERTGFALRWEVHAGTPIAKVARDASGRLEVNLAYRAIEDAFRKEPHRPSKVGRKLDAAGQPFIELGFISPEVGGRYRTLLDRLAIETGWPLEIAPRTDQNAVLEKARDALRSHDLRKGPSYAAAARQVTAIVSRPPDAEALRQACAAFHEATGLSLHVTAG